MIQELLNMLIFFVRYFIDISQEDFFLSLNPIFYGCEIEIKYIKVYTK